MMEYKGYVGKVEFDADQDILHGEVVGLRDVVTFQGKSVDELQQAFKDSIDDYLEFCLTRGEEPDKPCSGRFVLRINPELHRKLNMLAGTSGKSLNTWISECLDREAGEHIPIRKSREKTQSRAKQSRAKPKSVK